jgi:hypothetical protein
VPWPHRPTRRPLCTSACARRAIRRATSIHSACCRRGPHFPRRPRRRLWRLPHSRRRLPSPWSIRWLPPRRRAQRPRPPQRRPAWQHPRLQGPRRPLRTSPRPSRCRRPALLSGQWHRRSRRENRRGPSRFKRPGSLRERRDQPAGRTSAGPKAPARLRRPLLRSRVGVVVTRRARAPRLSRTTWRRRLPTASTSR